MVVHGLHPIYNKRIWAIRIAAVEHFYPVKTLSTASRWLRVISNPSPLRSVANFAPIKIIPKSLNTRQTPHLDGLATGARLQHRVDKCPEACEGIWFPIAYNHHLHNPSSYQPTDNIQPIIPHETSSGSQSATGHHRSIPGIVADRPRPPWWMDIPTGH